ncbi:MAG: exodeoxyribonuclease V subunit alpha [Gammaproteobacteria bacterium]|nr:exodeoxyribonuclease V subunit alpha [Gammaproteobacteria bacterium]
MHEFLLSAISRKALRAVDFYFGRRMTHLAGTDDPYLFLAAALVSHRVGEGDVCMELGACGEFPLFTAISVEERPVLPAPDEWSRSLRRCTVVGAPGDHTPLILDTENRLYLARYWHFEQMLARALAQRVNGRKSPPDRMLLGQGLRRLFPETKETDWQRVAATMAVLQPFCVISGGPGTGKTHTVTSILALLIEQAGVDTLRIELAAPTGKAAARLTDSIRKARQVLSLDREISERIPEVAITLHRLLGFRAGRANPKYHAENPLHLDILVVDEASMVDLPLMARLFEALPPQARIILLGDRDQLASVEAGRVLGDICGGREALRYSKGLCDQLRDVSNVDLRPAVTESSRIADHIVVLENSRRFGPDSGIGILARAVNEGDCKSALSILEQGQYPDVSWLKPAPGKFDELMEGWVLNGFRPMLSGPDPEFALQALNIQRVLCSVRDGRYGVHAVNRRIEQLLEREGLIHRSGAIYPGRPIMVTANDHVQQLYNGDVGLILPDPDSDGALRVFFETSDGLRRILPSRLPAHETVYAMTVHKSQGSEFDEVLLMLPDRPGRVVTRELIYTGITRAKKRVLLWADAVRLQGAIEQRTIRSTGLREALWVEPATE